MEAMKKLRFGVCGLGFMGASHVARLLDHPQAELVAVCDRDIQRCENPTQAAGNLDLGTTKVGGSIGADVTIYEDVDKLIADPRVDALVVALPTRQHAPVTIRALQANKHVLVEKPMAYRAGECTRMIAAAERTKRTLMVAQCIRFWPEYQCIRDAIREERVGNIKHIILRRRGSPPTYSKDHWLMDAEQSGGAILDLHVHDVDYTHWLLGIPDTIFARGATGPSGGVDHVVTTYAYQDGRYALVEGGWTHTAPWPFEMAITVQGERGTLDWNSTTTNEVRLYAGGDQPEVLPATGDALRNELDYFISCVQNGQSPALCPPIESQVSVALAWLERRSVELGRPVHVTRQLREAWGV